MNSLRVEADNAVTRAEEAEAKNKKYEQALLEKDQEITSLQHRLGVLDAELEKAEAKVADSKAAQMEGEHSKMTSEGLTRKIQLLEEELDAAEKNVKETVEKCVSFYKTKGLVDRSHSSACLGCGKLMSRQSTSSDRYSVSSKSAMRGRRNTRCVSKHSTAPHCSFYSNYDPPGSTREVAEISSRTGRLGSKHAGSVIVLIYSSNDILTNLIPVSSHILDVFSCLALDMITLYDTPFIYSK